MRRTGGFAVVAAVVALGVAACDDGAGTTAPAGGTQASNGPESVSDFVEAFAKAAAPCDEAYATYSKTASADGADVNSVRAVATTASQACATSVQGIETMKVTAPVDPARALCADGYRRKRALMDYAAKIDYGADSQLAEMQTLATGANAKLEECLNALKKLQS